MKDAFSKLTRSAGPREETDLASIQSANDRRRARIRWLVASGFVALGFILMFAFILRAPFWKIREIAIEGNRLVSTEEIRGLLWARVFREQRARYLMGFHNMLIWPDALDDSDLRFIPELEEVRIEKDLWRNRVKIEVVERELIGIWCFARNATRSNCAWFDREGGLVSRAPAVEGSLIPAVVDLAQEPRAIGAKILPDRLIANLFSVLRVLAASGLAIKEVRIEDLERQELEVSTYDGPEMFFSLRFPAEHALAVLRSLRGDRSVEFSGLEYVDFRVENRAYYR